MKHETKVVPRLVGYRTFWIWSCTCGNKSHPKASRLETRKNGKQHESNATKRDAEKEAIES